MPDERAEQGGGTGGGGKADTLRQRRDGGLMNLWRMKDMKDMKDVFATFPYRKLFSPPLNVFLYIKVCFLSFISFISFINDPK